MRKLARLRYSGLADEGPFAMNVEKSEYEDPNHRKECMTVVRVPSPMLVPLLSLVSWMPLHATNACDLPQLRNQKQDAATVQRLEDAWSTAFLRGDTEFMSCLLIPEFTEIMRSGALKVRVDDR